MYVFLVTALLSSMFTINPDTGDIEQNYTAVSGGDGLYSSTDDLPSEEEYNDMVGAEVEKELSPDEETVVSGGDAGNTSVAGSEELVSLLSETIELLSSDSANVLGTFNSSVLDFMDRIVDGKPDYKYVAFRTSSSDTYATTMYLAKKASYSGNTITFSDDCVAVRFYRDSSSGYNNYLYYTINQVGKSTVTIGSNTIVYTNVIDNYPLLGSGSGVVFRWQYLLCGAVVLAVLGYVLGRRLSV